MSNLDLIRRQAVIGRGGGHVQNEEKEYEILEPKLRKLDLKFGKVIEGGTNCQVYKNKELEKIYGRKGLCIKEFWRSKSYWGYEGAGGLSTIYESTIAQNLLAIKGLAPRIYELVLIEGKTCQITDYVIGKQKMKEIKDDRFEFYKDDMNRDHNWRGAKLIDFQGVKLKNYSEYKNEIIKKIIKVNGEHGHTFNLYQSTEYHGGLRDTQERLKRYKFKEIKGKTVLDVGCNNGGMSRVMYDMGAKRVIGIDWPNLIELTKELAILDGYFNIDFFGYDIKKLKWTDFVIRTGIVKFDIMLFLAMEVHVGRPEWLKKSKLLYYEGHGEEREFHLERNGEEKK